jgi:hypothetical protein
MSGTKCFGCQQCLAVVDSNTAPAATLAEPRHQHQLAASMYGWLGCGACGVPGGKHKQKGALQRCNTRVTTRLCCLG